MDRHDFQKLRFSVQQEFEVTLGLSQVETDEITNNVMRLFLQTISASEVKRQTIAQQFKNFKRSPEIPAPSWAFKNPGLSSRIPTLKEA